MTKELKLTPKQKKFADGLLEGKTQTQAVLDACDIDDVDSASTRGSKMIRNDRVIEYLKSKSYMAAARIEELAESAKNENVKLSANKDILDRAGYKVADVQVDQSVNVNVLNYTSD